ncbi:aminopeptidase S [Stackebrandtia albiflava]|uniref:Aminopeptidase S n=1 Tax=Stackebrandtia albiflava TaxID=406432 RepID=A0A562V2F4_9ACTN|nr:M20/M25/M40 family metallo-hydrolase [Stackebrandtia albiflava]TWJ12002.1 aminopeptidase S [Stackebrandtia albiflava]
MSRRPLLAVTGAVALAASLLTAGAASAATTTAAPDIDVAAVQAHLTRFQSIADANGGNRAAGTTGYDRSADYVAAELTAAGFDVTRQTCTGCYGQDQNIIADWPGGDTSQTIMLGAHLDGVRSGPGINDNASGSAALLEVALTLAAQDPTVTRHLRFAWWADEESGLRGSNHYVRTTGVSGIEAYLNLDMVGSSNAGYFVDNINGAYSAPFREYLTSVGAAPEEMTECCSDDGPFRNAGVPTSFLSTGASARKTTAQAAKWGGTAGRSFDPCYHSSCDSLPGNINVTALDRMTDATAHAVWTLAVDDDGTPPADPCTAVSAGPVNIVDHTTVYSPATVSACGRSGSATASVTVDITHTWRGDLVIRLLAPDGTAYPVADFNDYDSADDVHATYRVNLSGETADGSWRLSVQDHGPGDTGRIDSWRLTL